MVPVERVITRINYKPVTRQVVHKPPDLESAQAVQLTPRHQSWSSSPQIFQSAVVSNDPFSTFNQMGLEFDSPITYDQLCDMVIRAGRSQPLNMAFVDRIWDRETSKKPFQLANAINALCREDPAFNIWWNS